MFLNIISLTILICICCFSNQKQTGSILTDILKKWNYKEPEYCKLREWLEKLVIDLPNDIIVEETKGYLEDLTLYKMSIERLITTEPTIIDGKIGVTISIERASVNMNGVFNSFITGSKIFDAHVSNLNVQLPFFLVRDPDTGLVSEVDTSGLNIDIDSAKIDVEIDLALKDLLIGVLKLVLKVIKTNVIEKQLIETMNEKLGELFQKANNIILNGVEPKELYIVTKESDRADLRTSPIISAVGYLLNNLTGADGPLSLNNIANILTYNTGKLRLHEFYNKSIHFNFNITGQNNGSLGNVDVGLEDLNISGLNTWKNFSALQPNDKILLNSFTDLQNLTINLTFSLKITLDNTSQLVKEETILYELANLRTNLENNTLKGLIQLPVNNKKANEYSDKQCLNFQCIVDLADSNGTGITALSLNETFTYIILEVVQRGGLEEDLDETIDKLVKLFIMSFDDKISLLINALLNSTVINLANSEINKYLYSTSCPGLVDVQESEINASMTSIAAISAFALFTLLILCPYILGKACEKDNDTNKVNLLEENEETNNRITNVSEIKNVKNYDMQSKYCIKNIRWRWLKEFGRTDPEGASLFLHPHIPIFCRVFVPLTILGTIALFISSNSATGASVYIVFDVGRRIQIPSLFDFGLINSVRDMWKAEVYFLSIIVAVFSGIWPYLKLVLMLISFVLPASLLDTRKRHKILMILDATGKCSILDSYVMILMLVAFHFQIEFPGVDQDTKGSMINVYVYAAYGFFTLILGTIISLFLSHVITHLHRSLEEHPDQNKGEKAESYTALISFAESNCFGKKFFISILLFLTLGLVLIGSFISSFSFHFHGLAGYALDLLKIDPNREYSVIELGFNVPKSYEDPNDKIIRFTQIIFFLTVFIMPVAMLINVIVLWFIPLPRRAQKIFYTIAEILNAWSCLDVFVVAIIAAILEISQFTSFIVGDKCDAINPFISKYFYQTLDGHNTCFEVQTYLQNGCLLLFIAAITFFISSNVVMKVCRNALDERLPDNVKEYLKIKKDGDKMTKLLSFSNNADNTNNETTLKMNKNNENSIVSNINNSARTTRNNDISEIEN